MCCSKVAARDYSELPCIRKTASNFAVEAYPFGFNGQEKVNEIADVGNHTTALHWEYDTRLGRRWNLEPMAYACMVTIFDGLRQPNSQC